MKYRNILILLASLFCLGWFVYYCSDIILWIALGWVVALLGAPLMDLLGKIKIKGKVIPASLRSGIVIVGFYGVLAMAIWWVVPSIWQQAQKLANVNYVKILESLDEPISHGNDWLVKNGLMQGELSKYSYQNDALEIENEKKSEISNINTPNSNDSASIVNVSNDTASATVEKNIPAPILHTSLQKGDNGKDYLALDTLIVAIDLQDSVLRNNEHLYTVAILKTDSLAIYEKTNNQKHWIDEVQIKLQVNLEHLNTLHSLAQSANTDSTLVVMDTDTPLETLKKKLISYVNPSGLITKAAAYAVNMLGNLMMLVTSVTFIAFFFLKDHNLLGRAIKGAIPDKYAVKTDAALTQIKYLLTRYFGGIVLQVSIITVYVSSCMWIFGISNGLLIGTTAALLNIIPYLGPLLGGMFAILVTISSNLELDFYTEMVPLLITVFCIFVSLQVLDNFILQPVIFSNSILAHPLEIFIVVIIGAKIGGVFAMICALPIYTIFRVIAAAFLSEFKVVQQLTHQLKNSGIETDSVSEPHPEDFQ